jgi:hypothetical protein
VDAPILLLESDETVGLITNNVAQFLYCDGWSFIEFG